MNRMGLAMTIAASALMLAIGFNLGGLVPSVSTLEFQLLVFAAVAIAICLLVKGEAGSTRTDLWRGASMSMPRPLWR